MDIIEFPCGCKFEINKHGQPILNPSVEELPLDCKLVWDMICSGNTKCVFQLESQLGQSKAKAVKPKNIDELSDLIAIIRPGCMDSIIDGKTLTQHYIDRKSGKEPIEFFHPALEPILKNTYGILVYQEQSMKIAQMIAGFSLQQADTLRKAIGKKKVKLMAKVKKEFLEGAKKVGKVSVEEAEEIFSWIEASQRYSFNKSHSICYAFNGYQVAYAKAHFPVATITAYIRHAKGKPKPFIEINELVNNAKLFDIYVKPPSILNMNAVCKVIDGVPTFGLTEIKKVGMSVYTQLKGIIKNKKYNIAEMTFDEFLMRLGRYIKSDSFESMIRAGAFDCYKISRTKMLYYFSLYKDLKVNDKKFLEEDTSTTFIKGITNLINHTIHSKKTVYTDKKLTDLRGIILSIQTPAYSLEDKPSWVAKQERDLLGVELTCHELDEYDTSEANCTCKEYIDGFNSKSIAIAAQIEDVRLWTIRGGQSKGKKMAFLKISDITCSLDNITIFTDEFEKYRDLVKSGNLVLLRGLRDKKFNSFQVKKIQKLEHCI